MKSKYTQGFAVYGLAALCSTVACSKASHKTGQASDAGSDAGTQQGPGRYELGAFSIDVNAMGGLTVSHTDTPDRPLLATPTGTSPIAAYQVTDSVKEQGGSFAISETVKSRCDKLEEITIEGSADAFSMHATLRCGDASAPVSLTFSAATANVLDFTLALEGDTLPFNQLALIQAADPDERFVGFGEQFTFIDLRGQKFPIIVEEGGIGRTEALGRSLGAAAGSFYSTYAPMPFTFTNHGRALLLDNTELSWFDLTATDRVTTRVRATTMKGHLLFGKAPRDVLEALTSLTGRMPVLPAWLNEGAVIGMQGGTDRVRTVLAQLEANDTRIAAFWLQDWVGQRETPLGSRLWWNWQLNAAQYPDWQGLVTDLKAKDIRVMTYVNPYLVDVAMDQDFTRNLYAEARDAGYLVKNAMGMPYVEVSGTFEAGIVDLTNPKAVSWYKDIIRTEVLGVGASGYMADFGEAISFDAVLESKEPAAAFHNAYAESWARLNRELFEEEGLIGEDVFFMRSGYTRSPGLATLFWAGDQNVTWDGDDGIQSAVKGMLSGGLSGMSLNHSDIGGYTALLAVRTQELLLRWIELSAFNAVFRTHEGNRPTKSAQIYDNDTSLAQFARFSRVFAALAPYRQELMQEASRTGMPVVRHMLLEYPDDPRAWSEEHTFMLGPDVVVAPVVTEGATSVTAYLPAGNWVHLWSGSAYTKAGEVTVDAPIGQPGVFYRKGSAAGVALEGVK